MGGKSSATPTAAAPSEVDFASMMSGMSKSMEAPKVDQAAIDAKYAADVEAQRVAKGKSDRDSMYSSRMDAAAQATDYVNSEITSEQDRARLSGTDYVMTDELKSGRINDYFATLWGEGMEKDLTTSMAEFGNPTGFEDFTVTRGDGSKYTDDSGTADVTEAVSKGNKATLVTEEDETLGSTSTILGG